MKKDIDIIQFSERIIKNISVYKINKIARETGFKKRRPIKITPFKFLITLCLGLISKELQSLGQLAGIIGIGNKSDKRTPSKQALFKRISGNSVLFMKNILEELFNLSIKIKIEVDVFKCFSKVLIQDSTCFRIADELKDSYPGPGGSYPSPANIRIQLIWNWVTRKFEKIKITPYTENDQSNSPEILDFVTKGSLIIRDLGYSSLKVFQEIILSGAFFLSRFVTLTFIYSPVTDKQIFLPQCLRKAGSLFIDMPILLGGELRLPCRLVAVRLPEQVVNKRRREANKKNKSNGRDKYSKEYIELLAWNIFITNVPDNIWETKTAISVYKLRWQIELIFKTWKSYFSLEKIETKSKNVLETFIYAKLIGIMLIYSFVAYLEFYSLASTGKQLSFMKATKIISGRLTEFIRALFSTKNLYAFLEGLAFAILRLCPVESRERRTTYEKLLLLKTNN